MSAFKKGYFVTRSSMRSISRYCDIKKLYYILMVALLVSCQSILNAPATDQKGRPYNAKTMAKEWRSKYKKDLQNYQYPQDNDSEYSFPIYNKPPYTRPKPKPKAPPIEESYPKDHDSEYYNSRYPKYDPEEDNSGYYYQKGKKLPPRRKRTDGNGDYSYPIYFDE